MLGSAFAFDFLKHLFGRDELFGIEEFKGVSDDNR